MVYLSSQWFDFRMVIPMPQRNLLDALESAAIFLSEQADELVAIPARLVQVIVGEFAPLQ